MTDTPCLRILAATLIAGALVCVLVVFAPAWLVAVGVGVVIGAVALGWAVEKVGNHKARRRAA